MNRFALLMVVVAAFGCSTKPSEDDCRKAISNMQVLMGTENLSDSEAIESQVRRCKGGSSKKAVDCAIKAQTLDDLRKCEFFKLPPNTKIPGATGSAGSAAAPPAGSGSAAGSADPGAAGSAATGSAATGSAATGSATGAGSASGSAATGSTATPSGAAGAAATAPAGGAGSAK